MNQENKAPNATTRPEGRDLKRQNKLLPKTIRELAEIQERGHKLFSKKMYKRIDPNSLQYSQPILKTEEERKSEELQRQKEIEEYSNLIHYTRYYYDDEHEYRHVILPKGLVKWLPHRGLLTEDECIALGITQSTGWKHYMVYAPEPHILLFKRKKEYIKKKELEESLKAKESNTKDEAPVPSEVAPVITQTMRLTRSSTVINKINK